MPDQLPDYVTDAGAVTKDTDIKWRYGRAPDYTRTRRFWEETKHYNHKAGSLPDLVEKLIKNWEIEASFKTDLDDWRTVDPQTYTLAVNGGPPLPGEQALRLGTYNALLTTTVDADGGCPALPSINPNPFYCPVRNGFDASHRTFKRMMPTFAWEVIEVYAGPPKVAFRWRHWGVMKGDYVGLNSKGETVTINAHGGPIEIEGVCVAAVDDRLRIQQLEVWYDPMAIFREMKPDESTMVVTSP